jgi:hypothetical protein
LAEAAVHPAIFVLFSDGVLCGPINMKAVESRPDYYLIDQQEWGRPKQAWRNTTTSSLIPIDVPHYGETLFAALPFRDCDTYVDFAATDFALRKVLEAIQQCDGAFAASSKSQGA